MSVGGLTYLLFTLAVWLLYQALPSVRARQWLLLGASYLFYASFGLDFLAVLLVSTAMNHGLGALLRRRPTASVLWFGIATNVLLLAVFKYLPAATSPALPGWIRHVAMPVGISFWTFQALSYLFDTYRDEDLHPTLLELSLFLSFWPTVLSGPVMRLPDLQPQLQALRRAGWEDVAEGTRRIVLGLFLKGVLAQLLAVGIRAGEGLDTAFGQTMQGLGPLDAWALAMGYGFQLFFDFAGYSHLVIGVARLFGVALAENFDAPYLSPTPAVFWTRWHMSLSFWIRDYVFLPLATRHRAVAWHYAATLLAMTLFGLWHGATLGFLLWGVYQGVLLVAHRIIQRSKLGAALPVRLVAVIGWAATFAAICLGWLLFRARDAQQARLLVGAALSLGALGRRVLPMNLIALVAMVAGGYFAVAGARTWLAARAAAPAVRRLLDWGAPMYYAALVLAVIVWSQQKAVFVYFQF